MKLYLSSYQMGDRIDELLGYLGPNARLAIVHNALDGIPAEVRRQYRGFSATSFFRERGLDAFDLDLRDYFGEPHRVSEAVSNARLVWAVGGNTFLLRRAMRQSGLDQVIVRRVAEGSLIYGGWSAGTCVAGTSLRGIDLMDDSRLAPAGYDSAIIWEGMSLVDFIIVPHFASNHPEAEVAASAAAWLEKTGLPFQAIRDGEVIVR
jgi:dipeptidase E